MGTPTRRRAAAALAAGAVLVALSACVSPPPSDPDTSATGSATDLSGFHAQSLAWEECTSYAQTAIEDAAYAASPQAECALLTVPMDYSAPDGETIQIAVMRFAARGDAIGSLVLNPGGPGGSGLFAAAMTSTIYADSPLTERFDLVGFDPRGVGASLPAVDCYSDEEADDATISTSAIDLTAPWTAAMTQGLHERCLTGTGEALHHMGTRDAARDIDVLRAVLGDEQLTFLGQSYGTRLGAAYAEQFPERVRAMVLDGAISPLQGTAERRLTTYTSFQQAFDRMLEACTATGDCLLGPDPDATMEEYHAIVRPLFANPVPALGAELDFDLAIGGVISALYSESAWPRIWAGLEEIQASGTGDELMQLSRDFALRGPDGRWPNVLEANLAVNCLDEDRLTAAEAQSLRDDIHTAAPFMDPGVDAPGARDTCEAWPVEPTLGFPYATEVKGLADTLVVSITGDPTTPHAGGIELAHTLGSALLTVEGEGHAVTQQGANPCVDDIVADYLVDLELPNDGTTCQLGQ